jgi:hypothetical protein
MTYWSQAPLMSVTGTLSISRVLSQPGGGKNHELLIVLPGECEIYCPPDTEVLGFEPRSMQSCKTLRLPLCCHGANARCRLKMVFAISMQVNHPFPATRGGNKAMGFPTRRSAVPPLEAMLRTGE